MYRNGQMENRVKFMRGEIILVENRNLNHSAKEIAFIKKTAHRNVHLKSK